MSYPNQWAELLLERDDVQGRKVLERMIEWYEEHDGRADDFGRLFIVFDAQEALRRADEKANEPKRRVVHLPSGKTGTVKREGDNTLVRWDAMELETYVDSDELRDISS